MNDIEVMREIVAHAQKLCEAGSTMGYTIPALREARNKGYVYIWKEEIKIPKRVVVEMTRAK